MTLVEAKYTNCGANLKVDQSLDAANCDFCGSAFIVDKAIHNYNIANAKINAGVVNVNINAASDFVIEGGVLKKYRGNEENLVIPDTVIKIGERAFEGCISLVTVQINEKVKSIGKYAFSGCSRLTQVNITSAEPVIEYLRILTRTAE